MTLSAFLKSNLEYRNITWSRSKNSTHKDKTVKHSESRLKFISICSKLFLAQRERKIFHINSNSFGFGSVLIMIIHSLKPFELLRKCIGGQNIV